MKSKILLPPSRILKKNGKDSLGDNSLECKVEWSTVALLGR